MPWVRFGGDFDWSPPRYGGRWGTLYRTGMVQLVTRDCAAAALAAGKAERVGRPDNPEPPAVSTIRSAIHAS